MVNTSLLILKFKPRAIRFLGSGGFRLVHYRRDSGDYYVLFIVIEHQYNILHQYIVLFTLMGHQYSVLYTLMGHQYMVVDVVSYFSYLHSGRVRLGPSLC